MLSDFPYGDSVTFGSEWLPRGGCNFGQVRSFTCRYKFRKYLRRGTSVGVQRQRLTLFLHLPTYRSETRRKFRDVQQALRLQVLRSLH